MNKNFIIKILGSFESISSFLESFVSSNNFLSNEDKKSFLVNYLDPFIVTLRIN